jgi:hypothetical protein
MKNRISFLVLAGLLFSGQCWPENTPENTIEDKVFKVSTLTVSIKDINDVGLVFVRHGKGKVNIVSQGSWTYGLTGSDESKLDEYMDEGDNLLIFVLWNKQGKALDVPYINLKQSFLDSWSYDFSLFGDGTNLFHQTAQGKGGNGVVHFEAFNVEKTGKTYRVSPASSFQVAAIHYAIDSIHEDLKRSRTPENDSDIATFVSVAFGN